MTTLAYTHTDIINWLAYRKPTEPQVEVMQGWREAVSALAFDFVRNSPSGPDQTVALRKLKEALMAMNAALVSPSPSPQFKGKPGE
jgi:hypothetical protein